jgi:two-component system sensor histidine kinase YesM
MGKVLHELDLWMDDFTIKKKFYIFYVVCVLIPLIVTDSVVFLTTAKFDRERREHEMFNIASTVEYSLSSMIGNAGEIGNSIYTNRDFEEFLSKRYTNSAEYVAAYQNFLSGTLLENALGMNSMTFTLYTDNDTIVNGGRVNTLDKLKNTESYLRLNEEAKSKGLFFVYDDSSSRITRERRIIYLQRLDFYDAETEKYLKIEFDYGSMVRTIKNMNYDNEVLICEGDRILLSNGQYGSYGSEFQRLDNATMREAYEHTISLYGTELTIYVKPVENSFLTNIRNKLPIILLLLAVNVIFPFWFVQIFNRSFTKRITELSKVFKSVDSDHLIPMPCEEGKDEISSMIRNYNRMVERTNGLIETVYKNKIHEQEMLVGRKNAELLALHSQINPHFLFNVLESIRMHSILKKENETADMVAKLAVMQRQYVEWGNDSVSIFQEIEFVKAYLALQKYRFGERLNYDIEVDRECENFKIPKLTIVTFVENACVHGIESKSSPGWIFVRIGRQGEGLEIEIEDTGSGMAEAKLTELQNNMCNADIEMLKGGGRVGIINACVRLKMVTENRVKFRVEGEEGVGTTVTIRIPCLQEGKTDAESIAGR